MLNRPKQRKYQFHHNLIEPNKFKINSNFIKNNVGLYAVEHGIITAAQIHAAVFSIKRKLKDSSSLIVRIFPHIPVTKRPLEMPLGRGKPSVSYWAVPIKAGTLILELSAKEKITTLTALKAASYKFPIKTQIIDNLSHY